MSQHTEVEAMAAPPVCNKGEGKLQSPQACLEEPVPYTTTALDVDFEERAAEVGILRFLGCSVDESRKRRKVLD